MLSGGGRSTFGRGLEQQNLAFLTYCLSPYLTRWEKAVEMKLLGPGEQKDFYAEHLVDALLRSDSTGRAALYSQAAQNGWMTRNEIRLRENLEPMEGGDALTVQVNLSPLAELGKQPPAPPPNGQAQQQNGQPGGN
jgi:HK97 family phage portal protein